MRCPDSDLGCEGRLLMTQMRTVQVQYDGVVPAPGEHPYDEDYVICSECGEIPSYSWEPGEGRITLLSKREV